jgi:hypothetical protein
VEIGQSGMGSPPRKHLGRHLRNSPLTYVERVQTPVLWSRLETVGEKTTKTEDFDLLPMLPVNCVFLSKPVQRCPIAIDQISA